MIVSASRRSDIPALHADWFRQKLQHGSVTVSNPFNAKSVKTVSLKREDVDAFVFWTRFPRPLFKCLDLLDNQQIPYYFLVTINNYPTILEPNIPDIDRVVAAVKDLSGRIGADRIIWRYDPIVISDKTPVSFHRENFTQLIERLSPYCQRVVVSIIDFYDKVKRRFKKNGIGIVKYSEKKEAYKELLKFISATAACHKLRVQSCAENPEIEGNRGIISGKCIDNDLLNRLFTLDITYNKDKNQRPLCGCQQSVDIGSYNTCSLECLYCYAR